MAVKPRPFALERYFAKYEFTTKYLLCSSDAQSMTIDELLAYEPGALENLRDVWMGSFSCPTRLLLRLRAAG